MPENLEPAPFNYFAMAQPVGKIILTRNGGRQISAISWIYDGIQGIHFEASRLRRWVKKAHGFPNM